VNHDGGRLGPLTPDERRRLRALLLAATRSADAEETASSRSHELERLVHDAPSRALPDAAFLHRLGGTVLRGLDGVDGLHPDITLRLGALQRNAGLRQLLFVGALSEIACRFEAAGLSWVAMKGPVLSAHHYTDAGDRMYGDIDLLVHQHDFPKAVRLLEDAGYRHDIHNWALAEADMAGQITMFTDRVSVDLHWHLHYSRESRRSFRLRPTEMLGRTRDVSLGPMSVPTFDPVDSLWSTCFHAARSDGHRLVWFKDIERILAVDEPDLDEVVRRSRAYRVAPPVGLMLARAKRILGAPVPDATIDALTPQPLLRTERRVCARQDPIQFHEDPTFTRAFTRSVRSSAVATIREIPVRSARSLQRRWFPPSENETDDEAEKESYLDAVAAAP
jgi:Uncharacterised nucleotidyltransferase